MKFDSLKQLIDDSMTVSEFHSGNIPNIDLYMDQVMTLINDNFFSELKEEKLLTKTMIHNYSKEGLLKPVKGKKYSKEHILQMLLIYQLKNTLKISDIKSVLTSMSQWEDYSEDVLAECFDRFMELRRCEKETLSRCLSNGFQEAHLNLENKKDFLVAILSVSTLSHALKSIAESMIRSMSEDSSQEVTPSE
ncbi:MAG: DUF1836 domain-containing protein [Bacillota bacterium]|nr:DUF1836 domain-containing protein [Bacillota bacterium]